MGHRPAILVLIGAFWPWSDSSGPNRSFMGFAAALAGEFDFLQVSRDRPFGAAAPLVESGRWIDRGYAKARYCQPSMLGARGLRRVLVETHYDVLMLTGFFDRELTIKTLLLRRLGLVPRRPIIVSPRGEFSEGALDLKSARKTAYIRFARIAGLYRDTLIHATSEQELLEIRAAYPWAGDYAVAGNVRALLDPVPHRPRGAGPLRLAFIGRISPVKNLHFGIELLARVTRPVELRIHGPLQDVRYWAQCQASIAGLPGNVRVRYEGEIANEHVPSALAETDLFFMPSRSENFGHAIFEALSCGVPVLIGDQTPWRELQKNKAGWDLPLDRPQLFAAAIDTMAASDEERRTELRAGARRLAEAYNADALAVRQTRAMLERQLARRADVGMAPRAREAE